MVASPIPPAPRPLQWAAFLLVPLLSWTVGLAFLPAPRGVDLQRKATDRSDLKEVVLKKRPRPGTKADAVLEKKIRFLGADLPDEPLSQASRAEMTFYFEVLGELDRNWQMFLHIDRRDGPYRIHGDHFPTDGAYPTTLWSKGDFVADNYTKLIPIDAPAGTYDVWVGFYVNNKRLAFSGGDKSLHDGDNRIRAGVIKIK